MAAWIAGRRGPGRRGHGWYAPNMNEPGPRGLRDLTLGHADDWPGGNPGRALVPQGGDCTEADPLEDADERASTGAQGDPPAGALDVYGPIDGHGAIEIPPPRTAIPDPPRFGRHYVSDYEDDGSGQPDGETGPQGPTASGEDENEGAGGIVGALSSLGEPVANVVEPIVEHVVMPVAGAIGNVLEAASQAFGVRDAIADRLGRRGPAEPLANLYEVHPEARLASPRELGFRFVPIEDIRGTAVAGMAQRGDDFLPLPPFRGSNWEGRWQRIREANTRLQPLPPVDLIKYDGGYWVVDGHNRVAATIYSRGVGLDAMVVELVPMGGHVSEKPSGVLSFMGEAGAMRAAAQGRRPAAGTRVSQPSAPAAETAPSKGGKGGPRKQERSTRSGTGTDRDGEPR
jgi:hypothetical protein